MACHGLATVAYGRITLGKNGRKYHESLGNLAKPTNNDYLNYFEALFNKCQNIHYNLIVPISYFAMEILNSVHPNVFNYKKL